MHGKVNSNHGKLSETVLSRAEYSHNYSSKGIVNMKEDIFLKVVNELLKEKLNTVENPNKATNSHSCTSVFVQKEKQCDN